MTYYIVFTRFFVFSSPFFQIKFNFFNLCCILIYTFTYYLYIYWLNSELIHSACKKALVVNIFFGENEYCWKRERYTFDGNRYYWKKERSNFELGQGLCLSLFSPRVCDVLAYRDAKVSKSIKKMILIVSYPESNTEFWDRYKIYKHYKNCKINMLIIALFRI